MTPDKRALRGKTAKQKRLFLEEWLVQEFPEQVAAVMAEQSLRKADLARLLNVTKPWVSKFFRGENVTLRTAAKVALVLGCAVDLRLVPLGIPWSTRRVRSRAAGSSGSFVARSGRTCGWSA